MAVQKGQSNSGQIKKGEVRNPGGRPKTVGLVRELAGKYTEEAIATLAEVCGNSTFPPAARVAAANALLDRAHGRPESTSNIRFTKSVKELTTDELVEIISGSGDTQSSSIGAESPAVH